MSKARRIQNFIAGIIMLCCVAFMVISPDDGYLVAVSILSVSLLIYAVRQLFFYFTMARFMVGGTSVLIVGIITFNFGLIVMDITDIPRVYVMIYLCAISIFYGIVDVLRSLDIRSRNGVNWKLKFFYGLLTIIVAFVGLIFFSKTNLVVYFYCFSLFSSAVSKIVDAFRKTSIIFIS